ncbi:MAG: retention module-containing protein, partial [Cycloclasticus sp.]
MSNVGTVKSVTGIVKAIAEDGSERILSVGDSVAENEKIITGNGVIVIAFSDGTVMDLGSNSSVVLNDDVLNQEDGQQTAQSQSAAEDEVAALQQALANDPNFDPANLPATAAGAPAAGTAGNNGHTVVSVDYLNPEAPVEAGFDTIGIANEFLQPDEELLLETPPTISINDTHECEPGQFDEYLQESNTKVLFAADPNNHQDGIAVFTISLSSAASADVTVNFQTADGTAIAGGDYLLGEDDYNPTSGTVVIPAGETEAHIYVYVNSDYINEIDENFLVNLSDPINASIADGQGVGTIIDKTDTLVSLSGPTIVNEADTTLTYTVSLDNAASQDTVVTVRTVDGTAQELAGDAAHPDDYDGTTATNVTIAAGDTSGTFTVDINDDLVNEADETYKAEIIAVSGGNGAAEDGTQEVTTTILDDDALTVSLAADSTVTEGDVTVTYTLTQDGVSDQDTLVTVSTADGSAQEVAGADPL